MFNDIGEVRITKRSVRQIHRGYVRQKVPFGSLVIPPTFRNEMVQDTEGEAWRTMGQCRRTHDE